MQILATQAKGLDLSLLGEPYTTLICMHASAKHEKYWTEPSSGVDTGIMDDAKWP